MRKISRSLYCKFKQERKLANALRRERNNKNRRKRQLVQHQRGQRPIPTSSSSQKNIIFPSIISGSIESIPQLSNIAKKIRNYNGDLTFLDFSKVEKIYSVGMLWVYSEVYRKITNDKQKFDCNYPPNRKEEKVLQHIGFYEMIKKKSRIPDNEITEKDILPWHMERGDIFVGERIAKFLDIFIDRNDSKSKPLYIAIKEVIANAVEHAYGSNMKYNTWMLFGRLSDDKDELIICIGDLGKTIPATMGKFIEKDYKGKITNMQWQRIGRIIGRDRKLIKLAITHQTGKFEYYRGKGLPDARREINRLGGKMHIYSRFGFCGTAHNTVYPKPLQKSIKGTIIDIRVPLPIENPD